MAVARSPAGSVDGAPGGPDRDLLAQPLRVLESMAVGYLSMDAGWRITYVNAEGRRVLGATGREIVGEVIWDLYPATVGTEYERAYRTAAETGRAVTFDAFYPAPLDAWFELRAVPEAGSAGGRNGPGDGVGLYFLDVTARRAAQEAAELSGRRLAALAQVALALADAEDTTALVATVADQGLRALGADGGAVAVPDPADPGALRSTTAGDGPGSQAEHGTLPLDAALPVCEAFTTGRRVLVPDRAASSAYSPQLAEVVASTGCQAWACLPLRSGGAVTGVLTAGWAAAQAFDAEQLDLLETLASQCSQALARIAARDAERAAAADARGSAEQQAALVAVARALGEAVSEDDVLAVVATRGLSLLDASDSGLCLPTADGGVRVLTTDGVPGDLRTQWQHLPADLPLPFVRAAVSGTSHFISDAEEALRVFPAAEAIVAAMALQGQASTPLRARGRLLGSLNMGFTHVRAWPRADVELVEAFAALTAQALERIASHASASEATAAARRSAAQQAALVVVAQDLGDAEDEGAVLAVVAGRGLGLLGASAPALCLLEADGRDVRVLTTEDVATEIRVQLRRLPVDFPLPLVQCAVTGAAHHFDDLAATVAAFPAAEPICTALGVHAQASVPLRASGRLLGSLSLGFTHDRTWPRDDLDLLGAFAALTAQALARIASRDAEQATTIQQATLVALAAALGQTESEADVLAVVAARSLGLLGATGSGVHLLEPGGAGVRTAAAGTVPSAAGDPVQHLPADHPMPVVDTALTGRSQFLADRAEAATGFAAAEEHDAAGGVRASAQVPLTAQGRLLGSLSLAFTEARPWPPADRAVVEAFGVLVAQALARIGAHDAERAASAEVARFSETLQRSLLTSPPEPDHLHIAVRYLPATGEAQVGGDWYDAFVTGDGTTNLVIGDVTGHDRTAAAAMGQLRNLLRGIAYAVGDPPAAVLTTLDRAAHDLAVDTTATAVLARLEQTPEQHRTGERLLRWSNAGHPPPLLITPEGTATYLEAVPDLLLGIDPQVARHDHQVLLAPGSTVLLYTDGLVERRGAPLQQGLDWLAATAAQLADLPVDDLCDALLALVGDRVADDVALLALRARPEVEPRPVEAGPGDAAR